MKTLKNVTGENLVVGASNFIGVIIFAITRHYITEDDLF